VVLVTGSGCGLGAALARAAAQRHARVVVNCRDDERRADALGQDIQRHGGEALVCRADVTSYAEASGLVDEALRVWGRVDVLVNAVGVFAWKPVADTAPEEWRGLMASNLDSVYHMSRLVLPSMRRNRWGRIVNLGAVGAERAEGLPKVAAYSAAKAAVVAFSKALALEEARSGITVNVVSPGVLESEDDGRGAVGTAYSEDRIPVGRPGHVDDLVRAVLFFCSPAADFVTGQVLAVAGGWRL
jgi:3-oxoacyl-[acyl-carrier protein] reductase